MGGIEWGMGWGDGDYFFLIFFIGLYNNNVNVI